MRQQFELLHVFTMFSLLTNHENIVVATTDISAAGQKHFFATAAMFPRVAKTRKQSKNVQPQMVAAILLPCLADALKKEIREKNLPSGGQALEKT